MLLNELHMLTFASRHTNHIGLDNKGKRRNYMQLDEILNEAIKETL